MEKRDLLDKNRKPIGETTTGEGNVEEGKYIQIVIICFENDNHEFLIQKRAEKKNGKWALTGGHVVSGEDSVTAIIRETQEELGLKLTENELEWVFSKRAYDCFVGMYYVRRNMEVSILNLEKEEVEKVEWASLEKIKELRQKGIFLECHYDCLRECMYFLKKIEEEEKKNV